MPKRRNGNPNAEGRGRPRRSPSDVDIAEVLLAGLNRRDPGPNPTKLQARAFTKHETLTMALVSFWGTRKVSDVTPDTAQEYRTERSRSGPRVRRGERPRRSFVEPTTLDEGAARKFRKRSTTPKPARTTTAPKAGGTGTTAATRTLSMRTINGELEHLRTQLNVFASENELNWPAARLGSLKHPKAKAHAVLVRADYVRLMWAARGATYDPQTAQACAGPRGLKPACFRPATSERYPGTRKRWRRHFLRFILVSHYTGSTVDCVARLLWEGDPEGDASFVDVEAGLLYRLGPHAALGKQAGMPVPVCPRLLTHLRRWRELDRTGGFARVVHSLQFPNATQPPTDVFRSVRADAGYAKDEVHMRMFRDSTAAELMRKGVSVRSAATFLGMDAETFRRRYERHREDFHEAARRSLESRAPTIRSMPAASAAWRAAQVRRLG